MRSLLLAVVLVVARFVATAVFVQREKTAPAKTAAPQGAGPLLHPLSSPSSPSPAGRPALEGPASETAKPTNSHPPDEKSSTSETTTSAAEADASKDVIEVVLSFDDGPHVETLDSGRNHTQKVFETLRNNLLQKNIKAVFFVQTHAPGRGETQIGQDIIGTLGREGHVLGIHSGSSADHASHRIRSSALPYDANQNGLLDIGDGLNGLESDLIRARERIRKLTGSVPLYVRPTYGEKSRRATAVYRRQRLKMIMWDIDSGDNTGSPSVDEVNRNIQEGIRRCVAAGKKQLVVLFHDINYQTAANLEEYIATICVSARRLKKTVVFPSSAESVVQILNAKTFP